MTAKEPTQESVPPPDTSDVHTDPAALADLTDAAQEKPETTPDGAAAGYAPSRTLAFGVEMRRQLRRRRTQLVLALVAVLPFVLVGAFAIGTNNPNRRAGGFVDLATVSAPNFVVVTLLISAGFLLPTTVALFFGDTVASEASWSSLKYLLAAPVPRQRLLRQKALVAGALSAVSLAVLPAVALLVGTVFYGAGEAISPTGDAASFGSAVVSLVMAWAYIVLQLTWIAALAFLLSVSTDAPLGAVGGAVLAAIVSLMLDQITALGSLRQVLPTHGALAWTDLMASDVDWNPLATGVFTSLSYALVFSLLAARRFAVKDITS